MAGRFWEKLNAPGLFFTIMALLLTIFTFVALGVMGTWALDHKTPLSNMEGRFIKWGDEDPDIVWIQWTGHRTRACPGTINRWIASESSEWVHSLPTMSLPYPDGLPIGNMNNMVPIEIPHHLDGPMILRTRVDYSCNPLQRIVPFSVQLPDIHIPARPASQTRRPTMVPAPGING